MSQRLRLAGGVIVVDDTLFKQYLRYRSRSLFQKHRVGGRGGDQDLVTWMMLSWLWKPRGTAEKYRHLALGSRLPHISASSQHELDRPYAMWNLHRSEAMLQAHA
ncbi:MAG: family ATPase, partial [Devosia sp.]|nr:family ATPase [Devosia sp.]